MRRLFFWIWQRGVISTFLAGLFVLLPIVITIGIMAWVGGVFQVWLGPDSTVGKAMVSIGLHFVADPTIATMGSWIVILVGIWMLGVLIKSVGKKKIEQSLSATIEQIPLFNVVYGPAVQIVNMLHREPADKLKGMNVVHCGIGGDAGAGFLGLLVSDDVYHFNGTDCQIVYVPTSPLPMSGLVLFVAVNSIQPVDISVDGLMKICFSIGVLSSKVIPGQYLASSIDVSKLPVSSENLSDSS
jgi:uncharacterized membrane protein